jgi:hypothetical protein
MRLDNKIHIWQPHPHAVLWTDDIKFTLTILQVETSASLGVGLINFVAATLRFTTQGSIDHMVDLRLDQLLHIRIKNIRGSAYNTILKYGT